MSVIPSFQARNGIFILFYCIRYLQSRLEQQFLSQIEGKQEMKASLFPPNMECFKQFAQIKESHLRIENSLWI